MVDGGDSGPNVVGVVGEPGVVGGGACGSSGFGAVVGGEVVGGAVVGGGPAVVVGAGVGAGVEGVCAPATTGVARTNRQISGSQNRRARTRDARVSDERDPRPSRVSADALAYLM
jgi:hypothetical protein